MHTANSTLSVPGHDPLCGRPTATGKPCERVCAVDHSRQGQGDRVWHLAACAAHMTEEERASLEADLAAFADEAALRLDLASDAASEPACWSWLIPRRRRHESDMDYMRRFSRGRCALCGSTAREPLCDYDPVSLLVRGPVCGFCIVTVAESTDDERVVNYLQQPPAAMLGLLIPHVHCA